MKELKGNIKRDRETNLINLDMYNRQEFFQKVQVIR